MAVPRWVTRCLGFWIVALFGVLLAGVAAHPAAAAEPDRSARAGLATDSWVDGHLATRPPSVVLAKRIAGTDVAVVPAQRSVPLDLPNAWVAAASQRALPNLVVATFPARSPPVDGTSRS
jgi:hypothetical protein